MSAASGVAGMNPNSAANSRSLSLSNVTACAAAQPHTDQ